ncbi:hypothetical protein BGZ94_005493 [Podila epigama]|nr:hypothetical protein BGZ94_005493 [Podila epigama]
MGADPVTGQLDCSTIPSLGNMTFAIGGTMDDGRPAMLLTLTPAEYTIGKAESRKCFSALNASHKGKGHWIFGLKVLRGFYTVYHYDYGVVGIAPYNITNTNPTGTVLVPGSRAMLEQSVQSTLQKMSSGGPSSRPQPKFSCTSKLRKVASFVLLFAVYSSCFSCLV